MFWYLFLGCWSTRSTCPSRGAERCQKATDGWQRDIRTVCLSSRGIRPNMHFDTPVPQWTPKKTFQNDYLREVNFFRNFSLKSVRSSAKASLVLPQRWRSQWLLVSCDNHSWPCFPSWASHGSAPWRPKAWNPNAPVDAWLGGLNKTGIFLFEHLGLLRCSSKSCWRIHWGWGWDDSWGSWFVQLTLLNSNDGILSSKNNPLLGFSEFSMD